MVMSEESWVSGSSGPWAVPASEKPESAKEPACERHSTVPASERAFGALGVSEGLLRRQSLATAESSAPATAPAMEASELTTTQAQAPALDSPHPSMTTADLAEGFSSDEPVPPLRPSREGAWGCRKAAWLTAQLQALWQPARFVCRGVAEF